MPDKHADRAGQLFRDIYNFVFGYFVVVAFGKSVLGCSADERYSATAEVIHIAPLDYGADITHAKANCVSARCVDFAISHHASAGVLYKYGAGRRISRLHIRGAESAVTRGKRALAVGEHKLNVLYFNIFYWLT